MCVRKKAIGKGTVASNPLATHDDSGVVTSFGTPL